jgi:hypothetical protein
MGHGNEQDIYFAQYWYDKSAESNEPKAFLALA